jgi:hypothetical protein
VSFAAITICVASERVFIFVSIYFVIDSVRKLLNTPSYFRLPLNYFLITGLTFRLGLSFLKIRYDGYHSLKHGMVGHSISYSDSFND